MYKYLYKKGVSPVIGVILLVAVTVALVALATVIVFDIGGDINETETDVTLSTSGTSVLYVRGAGEVQVRNQDGDVVGTLSNPGDTFNENQGGEYQIIAIQDDGSEQLIQTVNLPEPSESVQPSFSTINSEGGEGETLSTTDTVDFDASDSVSSDGDIVSYNWEFGDGNTAEGEQVSHSYDEPGTYTVLLTVEDEEGQVNTVEETITIESDDPESVLLTNSGTEEESSTSNTVDEPITFDASDSSSPNGEIESYAWDFGDSNTDEGEEVTHTYTETGTYTVVLTITDSAGETSTSEMTVTVEEPSELTANNVEGGLVVNE